MANAIIAASNRVLTGPVSETGWVAAAPAANAQILPLGVKARSAAVGTNAAPLVYQGVMDARYPITYAGLFDTNLFQSDRFRYRLYADTAMTGLLFDTRDPVTGLDRRVVPPLFARKDLRWGASNLFRLDLAEDDFPLYPTNVHVVVPLVRAAAYRWDIVSEGYRTDPANPARRISAGYVELGHVWSSDSLKFQINFSYGGANEWNPTDEIKRVAGGGVHVEPGTGYRSVDVPFNLIRRADGDRLFDLSKRVNWSQPVVWLPNVDDPATLFRYGFLGQRRDAFKKTWAHYMLDSATLKIEEITQ